MSQITDIVDFFTLSGHRPPATDGLYPLHERMRSKKRVAVLSVGPQFIRTATVTLDGGRLVVSNEETADIPVGTNALNHKLFWELKKKSNCMQVVVQLGDFNHLQNYTSIRKATPLAETLALAHDSKSILGAADSTEHRYAMLSHSGPNVSLIITVEHSVTESIYAKLAAQRFDVLRVQSSTLAMIAVGMAHPLVVAGKADLLVIDHGNATLIQSGEGGLWTNVRPRRNTLNGDEEVRDAELASLVEDCAGDASNPRTIVVFDSKTHRAASMTTAAGIEFIPIEVAGYTPVHAAIVASFLDSADVAKSFGVPNILRGLGHEFKPVNFEPTPLLPEGSKWLIVGFWAAFALGVGLAGSNFLLAKSKEENLAQMNAEKGPIRESINRDKQSIEVMERRAALAKNLKAWIESNQQIQPLVVEFTRAFAVFEFNAVVSHMSIKQIAEGNSRATHTISFVFSAAPQTIQLVLPALRASADKQGWEIKTKSQSQAGGTLTYEAWLRPSPVATRATETPKPSSD